jgi:anthranilate/para-aminobenzoate synthase component I
VGYFDLRGGADLSVVIRTILLQRGRAYLQTGGGIVADSDAQSEWQESVDKARLLETAIEEVLQRSASGAG